MLVATMSSKSILRAAANEMNQFDLSIIFQVMKLLIVQYVVWFQPNLGTYTHPVLFRDEQFFPAQNLWGST